MSQQVFPRFPRFLCMVYMHVFYVHVSILSYVCICLLSFVCIGFYRAELYLPYIYICMYKRSVYFLPWSYSTTPPYLFITYTDLFHYSTVLYHVC